MHAILSHPYKYYLPEIRVATYMIVVYVPELNQLSRRVIKKLWKFFEYPI